MDEQRDDVFVVAEADHEAYRIAKAAPLGVQGVLKSAKIAVSAGEAEANAALVRETHKAIKAVSEGISGFRFNSAIAKLYAFVATIRDSAQAPLAEAAHGYRIFDGRLDGATKVLLEP